ncbi:TPA: hypothetical protein TZ702_000100 [Streptococcus suis]|uniref:hypothetical protein n=1 Tax=Streptococcus suis TaxID=1307 RepID=UPI001555EB4C|nr:hypothetical protein [Streptococcus suis]MDG4519933.1 hypothetical protein [Streptococcus suis]MDW8776821.1 hypothetical protein [Streptococcus suis]NQN10619.1 hypothetical protein [Streptococcus suis]NQN82263.1 hypothetical protein [Streptococcus suis]HEL2593326.1 hypothetical protein [Streptococcus suis]
MIDQLAYSAANHFGELETSFILGRKRGQEEGRLEGRLEGRAEGRLEGQLKIARQMLVEGFADEMIARLTGLSQEDLDGLKGERK